MFDSARDHEHVVRAEFDVPSRSRMVIDPASTRKNSSVSGWLCQTKSPSNLASLTS